MSHGKPEKKSIIKISRLFKKFTTYVCPKVAVCRSFLHPKGVKAFQNIT